MLLQPTMVKLTAVVLPALVELAQVLCACCTKGSLFNQVLKEDHVLTVQKDFVYV